MKLTSVIVSAFSTMHFRGFLDSGKNEKFVDSNLDLFWLATNGGASRSKMLAS